MTHLLDALKLNQERPECYIALGKIAIAVGTKIKPYVKNVLTMVNVGLTGSSGGGTGAVSAPPLKSSSAKNAGFCTEALSCVAMFAKGLPNDLTPYMPEILPQMMNTGLSATLTEALAVLAENIPSLTPSIQIRLLDVLSLVLSNKPFRAPSGPKNKARGEDFSGFESSGLVQVYNIQQDADPELIALALRTLGTFDFTPHVLTEMVRESIVNYLDDDNPVIRAEAAKARAALAFGARSQHRADVHQAHREARAARARGGPRRGHGGGGAGEAAHRGHRRPRRRDPAHGAVVHRRALRPSPGAGGEPALAVRGAQRRGVPHPRAGHQHHRPPVHPQPGPRDAVAAQDAHRAAHGARVQRRLAGSRLFSMRWLRFTCGMAAQVKEESALLLGHLVRSSQKLVEPYVDTILRALLPKLRDSSARVTTCVLSALGDLARVAGVSMRPHVDTLLPLIIETLQDQSSSSKREVALRTLGQLASSTGYVVEPLIRRVPLQSFACAITHSHPPRHPKLLDILLGEIVSEQIPAIRTEVLKVLGILGALDPYRHKINKSAEKALPKDAADAPSALDPSLDMTPSNEAYYPTVAIASLMRILSNPSLATHHSHVIQAVVFMAK